MQEDLYNETGVIRNTEVFSKAFLWMFMGLFATGLISWFTYSQGLLENMLTKSSFGIMLFVEVVVVIVFELCFRKLPPVAVAVLFFVYAVINGITLSVIYYVYDLSSIVYVLFTAAILFGIFSFIGGVLKKDITRIGTIFLWVLFAAIIISIINMFVGNAMIDTIIDWVVLVVFFGITAWDVQQIKTMLAANSLPAEKAHIYGAMMLYLDFINIFLRLLSIFGKKD